MIRRSCFIKGSDAAYVDEGSGVVGVEEVIDTMAPSKIFIVYFI